MGRIGVASSTGNVNTDAFNPSAGRRRGSRTNDRTAMGCAQIGALNRADELQGVQFGLINVADSGAGLQIGLINSFGADGDRLILPFLNARF